MYRHFYGHLLGVLGIGIRGPKNVENKKYVAVYGKLCHQIYFSQGTDKVVVTVDGTPLILSYNKPK